MNFLFTLLAGAVIGFTSVIFGFNAHPTLTPQMQQAMQAYLQENKLFGTTLPFAGNTYNLAGSGVSGTATSFTLTSLTIKQTGQPIQDADLSDTFYLTLEPGSNSKQEIIGCTTVGANTGSTVTISGCSRGLSPIYPYTASTTLGFTHAGGSQVIFSDPPQLFQQYYALANVSTSTNILVFSSTTPPRLDNVGAQSTGTYIATTSEFASIAYVNATGAGVTTNASVAAKGVIQIPTARQAASSTTLGGTGAALVLPTSFATDTPQNCSTPATGGCVILSLLNGKLNQSWLDLTQAFTFSGALSITSSTTYSGTGTTTINNKLSIPANTTTPIFLNGLAYQFPGTRGASSTVLSEDGSGNVSWEPTNMRLLTSTTTQQNMAFATTTFAGATHLKVIISLVGTSGANQMAMYFNTDRNGNYGSSYSDDNVLTKSSSATAMNLSNLSTSSAAFISMDIYNQASARKLMTWNMNYTSSAAFAPFLTTGNGVWNNTSAQITSMVLYTGGANTITSGSVIAVYGSSY